MRKRILLPSIVSVLILLSFSQVSAEAPKGTLKGALHFSVAGDWLDPSLTPATQSAFFPLYLLHDALFKPMPGQLYGPALAESWTMSPDYRVCEFKLRKGVKFHNGDEVTSEDVVFSFRRYRATLAKLIQDKTEKVEAIDPHLVRFRFREPFPTFLECLLPQMSAIGWILIMLLMMNSMRASPTPSVGRRHHRNAASGLARLSMTLVRVAGSWEVAASLTSTSAMPA